MNICNNNIGIKVNGESMLPSIKPGDLIIVYPCKIKNVKIGNVIAFFDSESHEMVIHRVVKRRKLGVIVKGDNNWYVDKCYIKSKIVFVLKAVIREKKYLDRNKLSWRVIDIALWLLSLSRIIPLVNRRRKLDKEYG